MPIVAWAQERNNVASSIFLNAQNEQWIAFVKKFKSTNSISSHKINILQIGDSHIQGGYFTNQVRNLMNSKLNVSAGFTFPYNLAKTNGSEEMRYYSPNHWNVNKWNTNDSGKSPIAGYLISTNDSVIRISIGINANNPNNRSDCIRFYHNSPGVFAECKHAQMVDTRKMGDLVYVTTFKFVTPVDSASISFIPHQRLKEGFQLFSVEVDNYSSRVSYHALGINGITFDGYIGKVNYLPWMRQISPDCLIVSFGTNDIYSGKINSALFASKVCGLIDTLKRAFPNMAVIITSPGDHLRFKKYNNHAIAIASGILRNVAIQKNCLFWDFFSEMGGEGSSRDWYKKGWMFRDYVHLSKEGYKRQGSMFYDAFMNTVEQTLEE
ncbi:MAG TPA: GDSL-type esterase/lipase family protein [Bacteroidales bacterium]|nr:GDSL-type esterase/lipase family protein [Bacteroidales bacterium]